MLCDSWCRRSVTPVPECSLHPFTALEKHLSLASLHIPHFSDPAFLPQTCHASTVVAQGFGGAARIPRGDLEWSLWLSRDGSVEWWCWQEGPWLRFGELFFKAPPIHLPGADLHWFSSMFVHFIPPLNCTSPSIFYQNEWWQLRDLSLKINSLAN